jgi:uncharacterized Zn finger protein
MKIFSHTTIDQLPNIIKSKYIECPDCHQDSLYAGCIQTKYDTKLDEDIVLSFDVFCGNCGAFVAKWDTTDRNYFLGK